MCYLGRAAARRRIRGAIRAWRTAASSATLMARGSDSASPPHAHLFFAKEPYK